MKRHLRTPFVFGSARALLKVRCLLPTFILMTSICASVQAQVPKAGVDVSPQGSQIQIAVWPKLAPNEKSSSTGKLGDTSGGVTRITDVTAPQLYIYPLAKHVAAPAIMICPGGGYGILASDLEGSEIAHWLNKLGYVAAVLYYRVPKNRDGALQDGQRALSLLRAHAGEYGIDPARLGVMGFSAGGHLSARLAVEGIKRTYEPMDDIDKQSCRPDFALLIYPAYLTVSKGTNKLAPEVVPSTGMPIMFLAQTRDDPYFDILPYAEALSRAGVTFKNCVYAEGGHGYGLRLKASVPAAQWSKDAASWLQDHFPSLQ